MHLFFMVFSTFSVSHTCETLENDDQRAVALQALLPCFCRSSAFINITKYVPLLTTR